MVLLRPESSKAKKPGCWLCGLAPRLFGFGPPGPNAKKPKSRSPKNKKSEKPKSRPEPRCRWLFGFLDFWLFGFEAKKLTPAAPRREAEFFSFLASSQKPKKPSREADKPDPELFGFDVKSQMSKKPKSQRPCGFWNRRRRHRLNLCILLQ